MLVVDEVLENTEIFLISISSLSNDSAIAFESTILNVGIENDDSEPSLQHYSYKQIILLYKLYIIPGVVVSFELSEYSVNENGSLEVCVVLDVSTEVNITVILSANEQGTLPENMRANCK